MSIINLSVNQLRQAADLKETIAGLEQELAAVLGSETKAAVKAAPTSKPAKGGMSAAGKAKIAAAQKLRWAKINAAKSSATPKPAAVLKAVVAKPVKKGGMSAEGKARIVAAQKARWAKIKAAKPSPKVAIKPAKKFTMSAAAKAKISAAAKARWAKIRAAKK